MLPAYNVRILIWRRTCRAQAYIRCVYFSNWLSICTASLQTAV